jgi:hypothetical protein
MGGAALVVGVDADEVDSNVSWRAAAARPGTSLLATLPVMALSLIVVSVRTSQVRVSAGR